MEKIKAQLKIQKRVSNSSSDSLKTVSRVVSYKDHDIKEIFQGDEPLNWINKFIMSNLEVLTPKIPYENFMNDFTIKEIQNLVELEYNAIVNSNQKLIESGSGDLYNFRQVNKINLEQSLSAKKHGLDSLDNQ